MLYYSILLIIGNDIMPATDNEFKICSILLIFGAFVEAYIIGGITTEMTRGDSQYMETKRLIDYVSFSMDIHVFPDKIKKSIYTFMN